ncbi:MAG: hypothetical protein WB992_05810 [Bryobacteraceae bacterium]
MSARSIRRAAERKTKKLTGKAEPLTAPSQTQPDLIPQPPTFGLQEFPALSPAQLAANRANALLSTGPRTPDGKAKSCVNAVKSGLTGRTVLLPTDDAAEYTALIAAYQNEFAPIGRAECELVQSVADTEWRLHRIRSLEFALYTQGHLQFEEALNHYPEDLRPAMIQLQTHFTYEKQLRNLNIQEARLYRRHEKDIAELHRRQTERKAVEAESLVESMDAPVSITVAPPQPEIHPASRENGFEFSTAPSSASFAQSAAAPDRAGLNW